MSCRRLSTPLQLACDFILYGGLLSVGLSVLAACDIRDKQPQQVTCQSLAIFGAVRRAEYLVMSERQELAICQIVSERASLESPGYCTGTLLAPGLVLTAAHCLGDEGRRVSVLFGTQGDTSSARFEVASHVAHTTLDLAILFLSEWDPEVLPNEPLGIDIHNSLREGSIIQIVGFGLEESGNFGHKGFAVSRVQTVDADTFTIDAEGRAAPCSGDSGGPALVRSPDGHVVVAGVLTSGARGCAGNDTYTRVAPVAQWLARQGILPTSKKPALDCELLGAEGRCLSENSLWCDVDGAHVDACTPDKTCGYDTEAGGFRCIEANQDSCEGIGDRGYCDGDTRWWCDEGHPASAPCHICGAICTHSVSTGLAICNAN